MHIALRTNGHRDPVRHMPPPAGADAATVTPPRWTHLFAVDPLLVAGHLVALEHFDWRGGAGDVETEVVRHDLLTNRVREHLQGGRRRRRQAQRR